MPDIERYSWPEPTEESMDRTASLKDAVKYVEKEAERGCDTDFDVSNAYKVDYKNELNESQFKAATKLNGPVLVIAGAGSGKTRAITYRVSFLLENGIEPERILLLTFTRKASQEMLDRVEERTGDNVSKKVNGGTFHSFANNILRRHGRLAGLDPSFTIMDTGDSADAINFVKSELGIKKTKQQLFPNKNQLQNIISASRNMRKGIEDILKEEHPRYLPHIKDIQDIYREYTRYKNDSNVLDYDDLLEVFATKLRTVPEFRVAIQGMFDHILVDEYQDTNLVQHELLRILAGQKRNICVVGDDAQSIYAFRGANFENILRFPNEFPGCSVVLMEDNYRSGQEILDFSNTVINNAYLGYKKNLRAQGMSGSLPRVTKFFDEQEEARYIVNEIEERHSKGLDLKDMAVLYRSAYHGNFIQIELKKRDIPFVTVGGIKFIERKHVKDVMSFLRVSLNNKDSIAWMRILTMLPGLGEVSSNSITKELQKGSFDIDAHSEKKYGRHLTELMDVVTSIKEATTPKEKIDKVHEYYYPILDATEEDADIRKFDLQALRRLSEKYTSLENFLNDFSLEPPNQESQDKQVHVDDDDEDHVVLSTVHSAKGLEWDTVFIPHALDGLFPSHRSLNGMDGLDEERRLFYVSITRAKRNLLITMPSYSASYDVHFTMPSRFLAEAVNDGSSLEVNESGNKREGYLDYLS